MPLVDAEEEARYGAKAVGLGDALRAGLPVPPGVALPGLPRLRILTWHDHSDGSTPLDSAMQSGGAARPRPRPLRIIRVYGTGTGGFVVRSLSTMGSTQSVGKE